MRSSIAFGVVAALLARTMPAGADDVVAHVAAIVVPAEGAIGGQKYYLNVVSVVNDDTTSAIQQAATEGLVAFKAKLVQLETNSQASEAYTIAPSGFGRIVHRGSEHVLLVCFAQQVPDGVQTLAPLAKCGASAFGVVKDGADATVPDGYVKRALANVQVGGFADIREVDLMNELSLSHGEDIAFVPIVSNGAPLPSFYFRAYQRWSFPGVAGFHVPVTSYGGTFTDSGISFSLLFPVVAWTAHYNMSSDSNYVGFGGLLAPAILEAKVTGDQNQTANAFTLQRLAIGPSIDISGYVFLGGGVQISFAKDESSKGLVFLGLGPKAYSWLLGQPQK